MARRKKRGRTPTSAVSNDVNSQLPKEKSVKSHDVKVVENIDPTVLMSNPRIGLEDKKKFLEEQKELLIQYSREFTSSWQEYMKVKTEESMEKRRKVGQALERQRLIIREILYKLGGLDQDNWAEYRRQEGELEEYLWKVDKNITAIRKGVYEDAPDGAGTGTQQETKQDKGVAEESNCTEPDTCSLAKGIKKRPKKKKRRPKPAEASPTEPVPRTPADADNDGMHKDDLAGTYY